MKKKKKVIKCSSADDAMRRNLFPVAIDSNDAEEYKQKFRAYIKDLYKL